MSAGLCCCPTIMVVYGDGQAIPVEVPRPEVVSFARFAPESESYGRHAAVHTVNGYPSAPSMSYTPPGQEYVPPAGNPAEPPPGVQLPEPAARPAVGVSGWRAKLGPWWMAITGFAGIALVVFNNVLPFTEGEVKQWISTAVTLVSGGLLFMQQNTHKVEGVIGADLNSDGMIGK